MRENPTSTQVSMSMNKIDREQCIQRNDFLRFALLVPKLWGNKSARKWSDVSKHRTEYLEWKLFSPMPACVLQKLTYFPCLRTDEKSVLVNHPFLLACRLGCSRILLMTSWNLPDEVFSEEGIVDLSQARLQRLPSPENQEVPHAVEPSANGFPASSTGSVCVANENELLALMGRNNVMMNQISLLLTPAVGTCFSLTAEDDSMSVSELFMHPLHTLIYGYQQPQSSTVRCLMKTVQNLSRRGMTVACFTRLMHDLIVEADCVCRVVKHRHFPNTSEKEALSWETYSTEVTMLACQLSACVAEGTGSWAEALESLCHLFVILIDSVDVASVQKAASYLPRKHLPSIVRIFQEQRLRRRFNSSSIWDPHYALALNIFSDLAKETNLENLCMLRTLESVRGDARAARNLSVLPEPLRELFHVPFQDLYDKLTAGNQA